MVSSNFDRRAKNLILRDAAVQLDDTLAICLMIPMQAPVPDPSSYLHALDRVDPPPLGMHLL